MKLFSQETIRLISNIFRAHFTNEIAIEGLRKALARKTELDLKRLFEAVDMDQDGFLSENEVDYFLIILKIFDIFKKNFIPDFFH